MASLSPVSYGGFGCGVGMGDRGRNAVGVPTDAFVVDRVFEAVFVVIETRGAGFHFNEDHFFDALGVHAFEDEEVDWRTDDVTERRSNARAENAPPKKAASQEMRLSSSLVCLRTL